VRALYGDPEFAQDLIFAPERHYLDPDKLYASTTTFILPSGGEKHRFVAFTVCV
jgi:hypothetical protein